MHRILLLVPTRTYRAGAFLRAARRLGAEVVIGSEREHVLTKRRPGTTAVVDFRHPECAAAQAVALARERPFDAVVGVDDDTVIAATAAAQALGLTHNDVEAVRATRDKHLMRRLLFRAEEPSPWFELVPLNADLPAIARRLQYPCVVKPTSLAASRGVIRADDPRSFVDAVERVGAILAEPDAVEPGTEEASHVLVEGFIPGAEVALEGMLVGGDLKLLALFDKPLASSGPYFEQTIYLTPSRLPAEDQQRVIEASAGAAAALGLREGPVHADLRVNPEGAFILEIAARAIGGL